ncbi:Na+/H+ antiporter subunit E [Nitrospina watsonii]|uniref:Monovalent cation/H+ antiporter, subunit E n=1 Tax=Nitrospina watsonii TaxID=1323948 RepID=A0ABN8VUQ8_9BACT|nr:Na+/H+ antiporter subunit E [Nitrospina watsonii]CAI2717545.1 Putative Monovalent cation/H+ antiporter, subunit E [Nitrospina watsonii]
MKNPKDGHSKGDPVLDNILETQPRPVSPRFLFLKAMALFVFWVLLSASFEWRHLGLGLVLSFAVAWVNSGHSPFVPKFRLWLGIFLYLPWLFYKIVQSSLHLSKLILHPALPISPHLIFVETQLRHHGAVVLLGNSITLTPGTITVEVDRNKIVVHAIDKVSSEDVTSKEIESKIADIFKYEEPDL